MYELSDWIEAYRVAWEERDSAAAASLFSESASYRSNIYEEPHVGRDAIRRYWDDVTSTQSDVSVVMGSPVSEGGRATVEFWTRMGAGGADLTLAGCLLLTFADDGLCDDLREYWQIAEADLAPPNGWGD